MNEISLKQLPYFQDWNMNIYFNCSSVAVGSREACGVPFSCCKPKEDEVIKNKQCGYDVRKDSFVSNTSLCLFLLSWNLSDSSQTNTDLFSLNILTARGLQPADIRARLPEGGRGVGGAEPGAGGRGGRGRECPPGTLTRDP